MAVRYYLGHCEYKWTHADSRIEHVWVCRELGDELFEQCSQDGFNLHYITSPSVNLPGDMYCTCKIYVEIDEGKDHTMFALKYSHLAEAERI